jgi:hypothetical protein
MRSETHYCAHCTHVRYAVDAEASDLLIFGCAQRRPVIEGPHHCSEYEREPGADDDWEGMP